MSNSVKGSVPVVVVGSFFSPCGFVVLCSCYTQTKGLGERFGFGDHLSMQCTCEPPKDGTHVGHSNTFQCGHSNKALVLV